MKFAPSSFQFLLNKCLGLGATREVSHQRQAHNTTGDHTFTHIWSSKHFKSSLPHTLVFDSLQASRHVSPFPSIMTQARMPYIQAYHHMGPTTDVSSFYYIYALSIFVHLLHHLSLISHHMYLSPRPSSIPQYPRLKSLAFR